MGALVRFILLLAIAAVAATWYFGFDAVAWLRDRGTPALVAAAERIASLGRDAPRPAGSQTAAAGSQAAATNPEGGSGTGGTQNRAPAVAVVPGQVERKPMPVVLDTVGAVQPVASVSIRPRIDSQIVQIHVKEGDAVKTGDPILSLDARSIEAQIRQAEAAIEKDSAQIAQSQRDLARIETLLTTNVASRQQADTARTALAMHQATLAADLATLENLKVLRTYYDIRSPVDGRIGSIPLKVGSTVRTGDQTPLAVINQINPVYVSFAVPQTSLPMLQQAMRAGPVRVDVTIPESDGPPLQGGIAFMENTVEVGSGTLTVKAEVANREERLWPGLFVRARVTFRTDPQSVTVPQAAVQVGQKGPFVFVIKPDQTVELRPVVVDRTIDGQTVIAKGLEGGERVVVDGQLRLVPGARVEIRNDSAPQPAAKPAAAASS